MTLIKPLSLLAATMSVAAAYAQVTGMPPPGSQPVGVWPQGAAPTGMPQKMNPATGQPYANPYQSSWPGFCVPTSNMPIVLSGMSPAI
ncbi:MAG: hypothetical protein ABUL72_04655, partial [Armatimonadota bacterium]